MTNTSNADKILHAFTTVLEIFGWRHEHRDIQDAIDARRDRHATTLAVVRFLNDAQLRREVRWAFGLAVDIDIQLGSSFTRGGEHLEVRVTWASGGGDVANAMAEASLHLEWAQKANAAQVVLKAAVGRMSREEITEACTELEARRAALVADIRSALEAAE